MTSDDKNKSGSEPYAAEPPSSYTLHKDPPPPRSPASQTALRLASSPYPALLLSAINLASLPNARKSIRGYPSVMQCNTYTAIFAVAAYALGTGDSNNGSGLTASWSAIWLFFNARNAFKSRQALPIAMTGVITAVGTLYGYRFATLGRD
ncbi:hypothetical protein GGI03_007476 [Coemansia sp. RSA 2337]|nr:hypothetical protein GGI14_004291 [Coemansia sp. S680]KAJ2049645.1 hypothetical protein GGI08_005692 [Coemansia sp. S2]KAJ2340411.1 hypothetical protein GGH92_006276 [Coemansia sp. RSA 2673]KAJ2446801.1 hypothetical protein GGI03_007476 [Coemansia sp. RSA 2337]